MGEETAISWTRHTFNPWWGCEKIGAPGEEPSECDNCYAETGSIRFGWSDGGASGPALWGHGSERRRFGDKHWNEPLKWDREAAERGAPALVFCASYGDLFEARDDLDADRARLWELIEATPNLIWQLLTKRPEQVLRRVPRLWIPGTEEDCSDPDCGEFPVDHFWPSNVWIGTSVGTQRSADLRIPRLLEIPAAVRFLSCEPLLGPVSITDWTLAEEGSSIDWIIIGGESGPGWRPMDLWWAEQLAAQAEAVGIPVWFKQVAGATPGRPGPPNLEALKQLPPQAGGQPVEIR